MWTTQPVLTALALAALVLTTDLAALTRFKVSPPEPIGFLSMSGWFALGVAGVAATVVVVAAVAMLRAPGAPPRLSGQFRTVVDGLVVAGSALIVALTLGLDARADVLPAL